MQPVKNASRSTAANAAGTWRLLHTQQLSPLLCHSAQISVLAAHVRHYSVKTAEETCSLTPQPSASQSFFYCLSTGNLAYHIREVSPCKKGTLLWNHIHLLHPRGGQQSVVWVYLSHEWFCATALVEFSFLNISSCFSLGLERLRSIFPLLRKHLHLLGGNTAVYSNKVFVPSFSKHCCYGDGCNGSACSC